MLNNKKIILPENVKNFMLRLVNFGYDVYAVGGCVRDSLLGRHIADYDFTTNALPEDIINVFSDCSVIETGIKHGTVSVVFNNELFEITTFRIDGTYGDNRHPDSVTFTNNLIDDLSRRDFTINAMAADIDGNIIDYFNGQEDLMQRCIRCVGNPDQRFQEDALRILRGLRFAMKISGCIESDTLESMYANRLLLENIASERIQKELNGILLSKDYHRQYALLISAFPILNLIIPELHTFSSAAKITAMLPDCSIGLKLAGLLHNIADTPTEAAKKAEEILTRLRYPRHTIDNTCWLIATQDMALSQDRATLKMLLRDAPTEEFAKLFVLLKQAQVSVCTDIMQDPVVIKILKEIDSIIDSKEAYNLKHLMITGNDLLNMGLKGKAIGEALNHALDAVITGKVDNNREVLLKYIQEVY